MTLDRAIPPVAFVVVGGALYYAFSPACTGSDRFYGVLFGVYLVGALAAVARMFRDGTLIDLFKWRSGDLAIGVVSAVVLALAIHGGRTVLAPRGTLSDLAVARVYAQIPPLGAGGTRLLVYLGGLVVIAALQIVTWQGLVQQAIEERLGPRRGFIVTAVLFGAAHAPTVKLLWLPAVGYNPLVLFAALFAGLVWGFLAGRLQRLAPSMVSAAVLALTLVWQFRLTQ